jgi:hypothetical protein
MNSYAFIVFTPETRVVVGPGTHEKSVQLHLLVPYVGATVLMSFMIKQGVITVDERYT